MDALHAHIRSYGVWVVKEERTRTWQARRSETVKEPEDLLVHLLHTVGLLETRSLTEEPAHRFDVSDR